MISDADGRAGLEDSSQGPKFQTRFRQYPRRGSMETLKRGRCGMGVEEEREGVIREDDESLGSLGIDQYRNCRANLARPALLFLVEGIDDF